ncbi:hypothetical protein Pan216_02000 [Planctomycetes bacterium Pan216]|uniref:Uncharacterized protein n=1 Tax=Kolteria novifilia TaxID=2527975 RepID=A0A518AXB3_9BACT|nr:hypothetical protein Pan216_02000 [Planctomycetes bacterium Pan216]
MKALAHVDRFPSQEDPHLMGDRPMLSPPGPHRGRQALDARRRSRLGPAPARCSLGDERSQSRSSFRGPPATRRTATDTPHRHRPQANVSLVDRVAVAHAASRRTTPPKSPLPGRISERSARSPLADERPSANTLPSPHNELATSASRQTRANHPKPTATHKTPPLQRSRPSCISSNRLRWYHHASTNILPNTPADQTP